MVKPQHLLSHKEAIFKKKIYQFLKTLEVHNCHHLFTSTKIPFIQREGGSVSILNVKRVV